MPLIHQITSRTPRVDKFVASLTAPSIGRRQQCRRSSRTRPYPFQGNRTDDFVFITIAKGKRAGLLYRSLIENLLAESGLRLSSSGSRRSTYCFRHTYATFRLSEGVDVYFLAKQMGTSVKMIKEHYGHINPVKDAERILQGLPGWESIASAPHVTTQTGRVNVGAAKARAARSKPMEAR